jgi:plasmid stabilization system protein ParE
MVTAKKVMWSEAAKKDLFAIYNRLAGKSVERAKEWTEGLLKSTAELSTTYGQNPPEPLLGKEKKPYKYVLVGFYKIIYSVIDENVMIDTIYQQRQETLVS